MLPRYEESVTQGLQGAVNYLEEYDEEREREREMEASTRLMICSQLLIFSKQYVYRFTGADARSVSPECSSITFEPRESS